jgi:hypothetical protein
LSYISSRTRLTTTGSNYIDGLSLGVWGSFAIATSREPLIPSSTPYRSRCWLTLCCVPHLHPPRCLDINIRLLRCCYKRRGWPEGCACSSGCCAFRVGVDESQRQTVPRNSRMNQVHALKVRLGYYTPTRSGYHINFFVHPGAYHPKAAARSRLVLPALRTQ